jgi:transcription initiation factor IIE alpha subunit
MNGGNDDYFNQEKIEALCSGNYICNECGGKMEFEDEFEDTLICSQCGHSVCLDEYGYEYEGGYDDLYPTADEFITDDEENDNGDCLEPYEEVYEECHRTY